MAGPSVGAAQERPVEGETTDSTLPTTGVDLTFFVLLALGATLVGLIVLYLSGD